MHSTTRPAFFYLYRSMASYNSAAFSTHWEAINRYRRFPSSLIHHQLVCTVMLTLPVDRKVSLLTNKQPRFVAKRSGVSRWWHASRTDARCKAQVNTRFALQRSVRRAGVDEVIGRVNLRHALRVHLNVEARDKHCKGELQLNLHRTRTYHHTTIRVLTAQACACKQQLLSRGRAAARMSSMRYNALQRVACIAIVSKLADTKLHAVSRRKTRKGRTVASCCPMQFWRPSLKGSHRIAPEGVRLTALTERPSCQRAGRQRFASGPHAAVLWCSAQGGISTQVPAWQLRSGLVAVAQARRAFTGSKRNCRLRVPQRQESTFVEITAWSQARHLSWPAAVRHLAGHFQTVPATGSLARARAVERMFETRIAAPAVYAAERRPACNTVPCPHL